MRLLWFTWKDRLHPLAGGAETVNEEIAKRMVRDGHEVIFIVGGFPGGEHETTRDGFKIIRVGGRMSVYWKAANYYKKHLSQWPDQVIDEINTIPFFASFYCKKPVTLFIHQLAREIWFYEMVFPLSVIGYLLEPFYLWLLRNNRVITVSESTKKDLLKYGFAPGKISIISEGIEIEPVADLEKIQKTEYPTMLALGAIRPMKRTDHILRAFELAKATIPSLQLIVAGNAEGSYGQGVLKSLTRSQYASDIHALGRISTEQKIDLLRKAHLVCITSVKEGWGLVVTEANSQGLPAVVYNSDGLRDSVRNGTTGIVCKKNTPEDMAEAIIELLKNPDTYNRLRGEAWRWSREMTFEKGYKQFQQHLYV